MGYKKDIDTGKMIRKTIGGPLCNTCCTGACLIFPSMNQQYVYGIYSTNSNLDPLWYKQIQDHYEFPSYAHNTFTMVNGYVFAAYEWYMYYILCSNGGQAVYKFSVRPYVDTVWDMIPCYSTEGTSTLIALTYTGFVVKLIAYSVNGVRQQEYQFGSGSELYPCNEYNRPMKFLTLRETVRSDGTAYSRIWVSGGDFGAVWKFSYSTTNGFTRLGYATLPVGGQGFIKRIHVPATVINDESVLVHWSNFNTYHLVIKYPGGLWKDCDPIGNFAYNSSCVVGKKVYVYASQTELLEFDMGSGSSGDKATKRAVIDQDSDNKIIASNPEVNAVYLCKSTFWGQGFGRYQKFIPPDFVNYTIQKTNWSGEMRAMIWNKQLRPVGNCVPWSVSTAYDVNDCVYHSFKNKICCIANTGHEPEVDCTRECVTGYYWRLL